MGSDVSVGQHVRADLLRQDYALIEHGIPDETIDELIQAYATFTDELPDPTLLVMGGMIMDPFELDELNRSAAGRNGWHKYMTNHPVFGKPGGYTNRSLQIDALHFFDIGNNLEDDPKEYYHYSPLGLDRIRKQHEEYGWGPIPPEVIRLHERFGIVHELGAKAMINTMRQLEETHPAVIDRFITPAALNDSPIRLLFYHPGQGKELAAGHFDKGVATIQIAESHEGLRIKNPHDGKMQPLVRSPQYGAFFLAHAWTKEPMYPSSELSPAFHDIVNLPNLNEGRKLHGQHVARWSIIFFMSAIAGGHLPKKSQTHHDTIAAS
jgi:hypothetical protein